MKHNTISEAAAAADGTGAAAMDTGSLPVCSRPAGSWTALALLPLCLLAGQAASSCIGRPLLWPAYLLLLLPDSASVSATAGDLTAQNVV